MLKIIYVAKSSNVEFKRHFLFDAGFIWSNYYGNIILRLKPRYYGLATADINYAHIEESFLMLNFGQLIMNFIIKETKLFLKSFLHLPRERGLCKNTSILIWLNQTHLYVKAYKVLIWRLKIYFLGTQTTTSFKKIMNHKNYII